MSLFCIHSWAGITRTPALADCWGQNYDCILGPIHTSTGDSRPATPAPERSPSPERSQSTGQQLKPRNKHQSPVRSRSTRGNGPAAPTPERAPVPGLIPVNWGLWASNSSPGTSTHLRSDPGQLGSVNSSPRTSTHPHLGKWVDPATEKLEGRNEKAHMQVLAPSY